MACDIQNRWVWITTYKVQASPPSALEIGECLDGKVRCSCKNGVNLAAMFRDEIWQHFSVIFQLRVDPSPSHLRV
jgi:hypothetical protein